MRFNQTEIHCAVSAGLSSLHNAALIVLSQKTTDRETRRISVRQFAGLVAWSKRDLGCWCCQKSKGKCCDHFAVCRSFVDSRVDNRVSSWENTQTPSRLISKQLACSLLWTRVPAWKICKVASIYITHSTLLIAWSRSKGVDHPVASCMSCVNNVLQFRHLFRRKNSCHVFRQDRERCIRYTVFFW